MAKPSITTVKNWYPVYHSELVKVEHGTVEYQGFEADYYRVTPAKPTGVRTKAFFGETAWSDAQRYASDVDFQAWGF